MFPALASDEKQLDPAFTTVRKYLQGNAEDWRKKKSKNSRRGSRPTGRKKRTNSEDKEMLPAKKCSMRRKRKTGSSAPAPGRKNRKTAGSASDSPSRGDLNGIDGEIGGTGVVGASADEFETNSAEIETVVGTSAEDTIMGCHNSTEGNFELIVSAAGDVDEGENQDKSASKSTDSAGAYHCGYDFRFVSYQMQLQCIRDSILSTMRRPCQFTAMEGQYMMMTAMGKFIARLCILGRPCVEL